MDKLHFKFGLAVGFLITLNTANLGNIFYNIVTDGNWAWVLNGVLAALIMFVCAVMCDEALRGASD
ncbi:MAG TPA: hypothetical protein GXX13_11470 [Acinetobacter towneri]|nr:hypothetical protein [Acinetobacter towneri]